MRSANYAFTVVMLAVSVLGACSSLTNTPSEARVSVEPIYTVEGKPVRLVDGAYAGEDGRFLLLESVSGSLDNDEYQDRAAILRLDSRGTGIFYYLNVFSGDKDGRLMFSGEVFLGDRIDFDFIQIYGEASISTLTGVPIHPDDYGQVVVGFSTHAEDQAFSEPPRIYMTRHWKVSNGKLVLLENY